VGAEATRVMPHWRKTVHMFVWEEIWLSFQFKEAPKKPQTLNDINSHFDQFCNLRKSAIHVNIGISLLCAGLNFENNQMLTRLSNDSNNALYYWMQQ